MPAVTVHKVTAVPGSLAANAIYIVTDSNGDFAELYAVNSSGTATRRLPTRTDIETWIATAISGASSSVIVADIAARDALSPTAITIAYVLDASADGTVTSGGATYIFNTSGSTWTKIAEFESMDMVVNWADIVGAPVSSPAAIDAAVTASHTHANKTQLDLISEAGGEFQYNGDFPLARLSTNNW